MKELVSLFSAAPEGLVRHAAAAGGQHPGVNNLHLCAGLAGLGT